MSYLQPLILGMIVGAIFKFFNQPIPAPSAIAGILGIVGIYLGYVLVK